MTAFGVRHPVAGAIVVGTELTILLVAICLGLFAVSHTLSLQATWIIAVASEVFGVAVCFAYYRFVRRHGEPPTSDA